MKHMHLLGRITVLCCMRPIVTDRVARSVCRSVFQDCEPCKNDWDAIWGCTRVGPRSHVTMY